MEYSYFGHMELHTTNNEPVKLGSLSSELKPVFFDNARRSNNDRLYVYSDLGKNESILETSDVCTIINDVDLPQETRSTVINVLCELNRNDYVNIESVGSALVASIDNNVEAAETISILPASSLRSKCDYIHLYTSNNLHAYMERGYKTEALRRLDLLITQLKNTDDIKLRKEYASIVGHHIHILFGGVELLSLSDEDMVNIKAGLLNSIEGWGLELEDPFSDKVRRELF